jgi:hypothetical protein
MFKNFLALEHLLLPIMLMSVVGCAEFQSRKGLAPVIDGAAVENASLNKRVILDALASDALVSSSDPDYWYEVTQAGFNYVDDQCRDYFDRLFFLDRERSQVKSGFAATNGATAAVLGATHASAPSLAIVAAAFGLAAAATDMVAGTYLYTLPPATTMGFVEKLQMAYRDGAAIHRDQIRSASTAYFHIQRYLSLCLPPTIEAEIARQIDTAGAVSTTSSSGNFFQVQSFGARPTTASFGVEATSRPSSEASARGASTPRAKDPAPHYTRPPPPGVPGAITDYEKKNVGFKDLKIIQNQVLCVPAKNQFDQTTRDGLKIFQYAYNLVETGQIESEDYRALMNQAKLGLCPTEARNYFEHATFYSNGKAIPAEFSRLSTLLKAQPEGRQLGAIESLTESTRDTIEAIRRNMRDVGDPPSAKRQITERFWKELIRRDGGAH